MLPEVGASATPLPTQVREPRDTLATDLEDQWSEGGTHNIFQMPLISVPGFYGQHRLVIHCSRKQKIDLCRLNEADESWAHF
jgi:hypothetical protein